MTDYEEFWPPIIENARLHPDWTIEDLANSVFPGGVSMSYLNNVCWWFRHAEERGELSLSPQTWGLAFQHRTVILPSRENTHVLDDS